MDAAIEHGYGSKVASAPDQAADALPEFKHGLGQGIFLERIPAERLDGLSPRPYQRMVGHGEG